MPQHTLDGEETYLPKGYTGKGLQGASKGGKKSAKKFYKRIRETGAQAEEVALQEYIDKGYSYVQTAKKKRAKAGFFIHAYQKKAVENFLKGVKRRAEILALLEAFTKDDGNDIMSYGLPDYLIRKGDVVEFVEVKYRKGRLSGIQENFMQDCVAAGFKHHIIRVFPADDELVKEDAEKLKPGEEITIKGSLKNYFQ